MADDSTAAAVAEPGGGEAGSGSAAVAQRQMRRSRRRPARRRQVASEYIRLSPPDAIVLALKRHEAGNTKFAATLNITNPSEHRILFKIRTNNPTRYNVKPRAAGLLDPASIVNVQIVVRNESAAALQKELAEAPDTFKDKFQVLSTVLKPDMVSRLAAAGAENTDKLAEEMGAILEEARKAGQVAMEKLSVVVKDSIAEAAPVTEAPREAPVPAPVVPAPALAPARASEAAPAIVDALPQSTAPEVSQIDTDSLAKMRQHYNNLLRHTLTTSAQHDEQISRTTLALEAANRRYEEAMQRIKELETGGTRRRATVPKRGGAGESKDGSADAGNGAGAGGSEENVRIVRSGFPLWQVIIIALVMFVVGTLVSQQT